MQFTLWHEYSAGVRAVLKQLRHPNILDVIEGTKTHRLDNTMTSAVDAKQSIDDLELWFKEVAGKDNCYYVRYAGAETKSIHHASRHIKLSAYTVWVEFRV